MATVEVKDDGFNPLQAGKKIKKVTLNIDKQGFDEMDDVYNGENEARQGIIMAHSLNILRGITSEMHLKGEMAISMIDNMLNAVKKLADELVINKKYDYSSAMIVSTHILAAYQKANMRMTHKDIQEIGKKFKEFAMEVGNIHLPPFVHADRDTTIKMGIMDAFANLSPLKLDNNDIIVHIRRIVNIATDAAKSIENESPILMANIIRNASVRYASVIKEDGDPEHVTREYIGVMLKAAETLDME